MKRFHQVAHIKVGNKRVGYVMKPGPVTSLGKWYLADEEQFAKTVREGKVQYFQADNNGNPIIKYTDEEIAFHNSIGVTPKYGKDYWNEDISFRKSSIDFMLNFDAIVVVPLCVFSTMGIKAVFMTSFMKSTNARNFYDFLRGYLNNSMYFETIKSGGNNIRFLLSAYDIISEEFFLEAKNKGLNIITDINTILRMSSRVNELGSVVNKIGYNILPLYKIEDIISKLRKYELS